MGDKRWYLFTIFGNEVYMTPSFLFIMVLFVGMGVQTATQLLTGLLWIPVLFIGILLHELGHALTSRALGYGNSQIVFWGMGGLAINRGGHRPPLHQIFISLAGPLASVLLAIVSGAALFAVEQGMASTGMLGKFLELMLYVNAFWAVFNLLPIFPMDGGQAMRSGFQMLFKNAVRSSRYTGYVSIVAIVLTILASFVLFQGPGLFLLFLAAYFGYMNWQLIQTGNQRLWGR